MRNAEFFAVMIEPAGMQPDDDRLFTQHGNHIALWDARALGSDDAAQEAADMLKLNGVRARVALVRIEEVDQVAEAAVVVPRRVDS